MKVLVIGSRVPFPLHDGGAIATFNLLKGLAKNGCNVHFVTLNTVKHFISDEQVKAEMPFLAAYDSFKIDTNIKPLAAFFNLFTTKSYNIERFYDIAFERFLIELITNQKFDIIHFEGLFVAKYVEAIKKHTFIPLILRQHNIEFQIWERLAKNENNRFKKWYLNLLAKRIKKFEIRVCQFFNGIVAITKADEEVMNTWQLNMPITTIAIGFDMSFNSSSAINNQFVYHIGSMEWQPNIEAMEWLVTDIWPLVIQKNPNAVFYMAGKKMAANFYQYANNNLIIAGEIENLETFTADKSILVVPLKSGSGLRIKTIEAMMQGKAVITTTIGAQGLPIIHQKHCLIANTSKEIADAIILLTQNENLRNELAKNGQNLIVQNYTIQAVSEQWMSFYQKVSNNKI